MITQINNVAEGWWNWMWPMFWQVSVLVVFIGVVDFLLRRRIWPQVRYALWLLVLVKLILPPTFSLSTSVVSQVRTLASRTAVEISDTDIPSDLTAVPTSKKIPLHTVNDIIEPAPERDSIMSGKAAEPAGRIYSTDVAASVRRVGLNWKVYAMAIWLAGAIILGLWAIVRFRKLRRLHDGKCPDTDLPRWFEPLLTDTAKKLGLRRLPKIVLSQNIASPAVFGTFRPVLVLPADTIRHLSRNRAEHILLHELAHIKRGDLKINSFYMLLQIIYWFNPLLWLLRRRLQHLRELCCDATVAAILRDKTMDYRETILQSAKWLLAGPARSGIGLLGLTEDSRNILVRLDWLEKKTWKYRSIRIVTVCAAIALMAAFVLPMAKAVAKEETSKSKQAAQPEPDSQSADRMTNTIRGYVTDRLGRPRGNVYITESLTSIRDAVRTDNYGQFTLDLVRPEQKTWIAYCQPIKSVGLFTIPEDYTGKPVHVTLNYKCADIEGQVVDSAGKGFADRAVELVVSTDHGITYSSQCYRKTDKYGNYSASIPCGSDLTVRAKLADGGESERKYVTEPVTLSYNRIYVQMPALVIGEGRPGKTDDGKVLYSGRIINEDGRPVPGTRVKMHFRVPGWMSIWSRSVMTDGQGRWKRRVPREHSELTVDLLHPDYVKQSWQKVSTAELLDGTNVMVLKRGLSLSGVVRNQQGEPVENALVDTGGGDGTTPFGEVLENCTTPRTLADGSFSVGGLAAESKDIIVSATGYAPKVLSVEITDDMKPIEVNLKTGLTYAGRVVDIEGNPIESVKMSVSEWRLGNQWKSIVRITETDSNGYFKIENLPDEGTILLYFGKRDSGLKSFRKEISGDFSEIDQITMYKTPVFTGKVVDAETGEAIKNFALVVGISSRSFGDSTDWSRYYRQDVTSDDGTFSKAWTGYGITYPFEGDCCLKVEAKGYLAEIAPSMRLGEEYKPCVIRMTKADSWKGIVIDPKGEPAVKAQVGWVEPGKRAFIKNGRFDTTGFAIQTDIIVTADSNGRFELPPSRDEGLIVALHESGYVSIPSGDFKNDSQIRLIPWARIEGTIVSAEKAGREFVLSINPVVSPDESETQIIRWMFDRTSFSGENFTINYVPAIPLNIGQVIASKQYGSLFVNPQPGETYDIKIDGGDRPIAERKWPSLVGKSLPDLKGIEIDFTPEQHRDKMILVCFWDMNQRPARYCVSQLAARTEQLREKGVAIVAIQASNVDKSTLDEWIIKNNISFPSGIVAEDERETLFVWGVKSLPWLILTDRKHIVREEGFSLSELDSKFRNPNLKKLSGEIMPDASRTNKVESTPVNPSDIALLYHIKPDVRIRTVKMLAGSNESGLIDDLIRAHSVENYTPVHNEYGRVLQLLTGNRSLRGKGAWKAWLASEVEAGRLKIEYLPVKPTADVRNEVLAFALMGPGNFIEMAAALKAETYNRQKSQDALRYMVFNDHLPRVQTFMSGEWLSSLFAHREININDIGYFLNGLANPGPLRKQVNTRVRHCLDSDNPIVVANALNLIAGVEGFSTRFIVPDVDGKVEELLSSSVPEIAYQAQRAIETIKPGEKRVILSRTGDAESATGSVLQQLIESTPAGQIVTIPKGVYTEPVAVNKSLTLKGESVNDCIFEVTANKPAIFVDTKSKGEVIIDAVTIKWQLAASDRTEHPFAVAVKDTRVEVKNCRFQPLGNFKRCPVAINAMGYSELHIDTCRFEGFEYTICFGQGTKGTIRNSLVINSGRQGISLYSGATVEIVSNVVTGSKYHAVRSTGGTLNMAGNLIINNANRGVYLGNKSARGTIVNNVIIGNGTGISGFAASNVKVQNNIIADSRYAGIGMRDSCSLSIRDNIFQGNERGLILFKEGGRNNNSVFANAFWQNKVDAENLDKAADSIIAEPIFADADNGDFSLKSGPALQLKHGLTNPEIFKKLWKIWKNCEDKNMPATGN